MKGDSNNYIKTLNSTPVETRKPPYPLASFTIHPHVLARRNALF